ncbi:gliding motility lipoprotein GldB [Flavobacterium agrisoli]|uniref:Gliding motility lipoprotein GldB n=1 Tax=Flavobacterium agrisoli TaxID=2793066 RepID=A0A934UKA9_9FLAO|nr:gliding motility lipoprotein GldB [Flavobacterium agrisoli]MBK0370368.1 gliding motility lipoprotein GldB [Flavobacterium agrisoli]
MKLYRFTILLLVFFFACNKKSEAEKTIETIPVTIKVERFEKAFFEAKPEDLGKIKKEYPLFFPANTDDSVWIEKMQNPLWRELYQEVEKKYSNFDPVQKEFESLFQHIKYYFPKTKTPKIVTVIAEMDYNDNVIYADSVVVVALELYLGKEHKFYQFPEYIKRNFEEKQMIPDAVSSFAASQIKPVSDKTLLAQMIYFGKELYLKDLLLPEYQDNEKIGYTPEQLTWCQENEGYMWHYFLEKEMLYEDDPKLKTRFISPAPFSKFYLEVDNESPGRVGTWIGWQIVRSYMKNNDVSLTQLLQTSEREIFEKSKYKPKK